MRKKSLATLLSVILILIISILSLMFLIKFLKKDNFKLSNENSKFQIIYDKVDPEFLDNINSFCKENGLQCIFSKKDEIKDGDYIDIFLGLNTNIEKLKFGMVEKPLYVYEFDKIPSNLYVSINGDDFIRNGKLILRSYSSSLLGTLKFNEFNTLTRYKFFIKPEKDLNLVFEFDSGNVEVQNNGNNLEIKDDGSTLGSVVSKEYNDIAFYIDNNKLIFKVNGKNFEIPYKGKLKDIKFSSVYKERSIDEVALFTMDDICKGLDNCVKLDNDLSGQELLDFVIVYDFLPYEGILKNYALVFFSGNEYQQSDNKFSITNAYLDEKDGKTIEKSDKNIFVSNSYLAFADLNTIKNEIIDEYYIGYFRSNFNDIKLNYYKKLYVVVLPYEDIVSSRFKEFRGYIEYKNKQILIKTITSTDGDIPISNDRFSGFTIVKDKYKFKTLPFSNDIEFIFENIR
jgi:hypothetical protein